MLHTLTKSPVSADLTTLCQMMGEDDELLLLQDGVLCAMRGSPALDALPAERVYALAEDVEARGLSAHISPDVRLLDYTQFVTLSIKHTSQMAW